MLLTDEEIIKKLKIQPKEMVLDVGGSMMQHKLIKVDTLADIIHPEEAPYGQSKLLAKNFVKVDITQNKLPFRDNEFDIVLCTHTLEDLPSPFLVIEEISRVGKRGLIVTPSMGFDMTFTPLDYTDWLTGARRVPGHAHHKWFFTKDSRGLKVMPKNYPILYTNDFHIVDWGGEKEMVYVWKDKIRYSKLYNLSVHSLIEEYKHFVDRNSKKIKKGSVLFFVDNPLNTLKALAKVVFKRGAGYTYRKTS